MKGRQQAWIMVGLLPLVALLAACQQSARRSAAGNGAAAGQRVAVREGSLDASVDASGSVAPATSVDLSFGTGGRVAEVLVKPGQTVDAGQPLAVLDTADLALELAAAEASLRQSESSLAAARVKLTDAQAGPDQNDLETARINVNKAKDARWGSQAQRDSTCGQTEAKMRTQADCDSANASVLQAEDAVRLAELAYEKAQVGPAAVDVSTAREAVKQAEAGLAAQHTKVEQARLQLARATVASPISGTVTTVGAVAGQQVGSGVVAATVADLGTLEVTVYLDQADLGKVQPGQPAQITLTAFPDQVVDGQVTRIAPVGQSESGVVLFPVTISLAPGELAVRPGMTADVSIITRQGGSALLVPRRAVQSADNEKFVMVVKDGKPARVVVQVGEAGDTEVAVTGELAAGDMVLVPAATTQGNNGPPGGFGGGFIGGPRP
jgi:RND family efflux transporter MFP subunit